jgi:type II secretory ATPase GspE/PulE/Tfp pilus assembly ATPase PilB-like protein
VKTPADVTGLIHELIVHAYTSRATDLHLGTSSIGPWVRERVDGALADVTVSSKFIRSHREVFSAIKQLASLETGEQGLPQQGRFGFDLDGIRLDVRVSVLPAAEGESLAIRLKEASRILPIDQLGLLAAIERLALQARRAHPRDRARQLGQDDHPVHLPRQIKHRTGEHHYG